MGHDGGYEYQDILDPLVQADRRNPSQDYVRLGRKRDRGQSLGNSPDGESATYSHGILALGSSYISV
jgi:hypothetical protein